MLTLNNSGMLSSSQLSVGSMASHMTSARPSALSVMQSGLTQSRPKGVSGSWKREAIAALFVRRYINARATVAAGEVMDRLSMLSGSRTTWGGGGGRERLDEKPRTEINMARKKWVAKLRELKQLP